MGTISVVVPKEFIDHVDSTLARLTYLYPDVEWAYDPDTRALSGNSLAGSAQPDELKREVYFLLYRERIYRDTLEIRQKIYGAI